ncbi:MAG TPA: hypothetical protein VMS99_16485 [Acidimicrobiia bacterium]|nr:hypothetical protein [Acidimicrobiia bacterium]
MFSPEVPVLYAWRIVVLIVALDRGLTFLELSYNWVMGFLTGSPSTLVRNGEVLEENLRAEFRRREELMALLR